MSEVTFNCDVMYSQIAVFKYGLDNPYNDWNDIHIQQGFSWREGSVSFGTLSDNIECKVTVKLAEKIECDKEVIRAIVVPFKLEKEGIEIGSIMETIAIDIPEGSYELLFTVKKLDFKNEQYSITFVKCDNPIPRILIADEVLNAPEELLMEAKPAI